MSAHNEKHRLAAVAAGQTDWGRWGSAIAHKRYVVLIPGRWRNRRRCHCGCGGRRSHAGMANGVTLASGCELSMRRWAKTGEYRTQAEIERRRASAEAR